MYLEHGLLYFSGYYVEKLPGLRLVAGTHTLTIYGLDPGVTLDWFEIAFTGAPRAYGPVPETKTLTAQRYSQP